MCGFISGLSILFHWSVLCASTMLSWWLYVCIIVWNQVSWFLQLHSSFSRLLWLLGVFRVSIRIVKFFCSNSVESAIGNLMGVAFYLYITFDSMVIFTVLILPAQEHRISISPSVCVVCDFFHQCLVVFYTQLFCLHR